ncbi:MAG TPA: pyridoxamine 5'-phosphate oxidase family protein [Cyclobacteriaceae bacterium]|nr:pyridoxamine 5'-phosphate oxidase family protein [Cyclobacteriaceae bacterium]
MHKDLKHEEAIAKVKDLAKEIKICMFCTDLGEQPFATRPMAVREVDDQGNLWFISSADSQKNLEIKQDEDVQLIFAKPSSSQFLSLFGKAAIYRDREKIEGLWTPIANAWFEEGKNDTNITVLKVSPIEAYYWDTPNGKMVTLLKIAAAALTGKRMDTGEQGEIEI